MLVGDIGPVTDGSTALKGIDVVIHLAVQVHILHDTTAESLSLASVHNLRSFISVENLAGLLVSCAGHPGAAGELFIAADGEDASTPQLIGYLAEGLGCQAHLWPLPVGVIRFGSSLTGDLPAVSSLCDSLQADASKAVSVLG